MKNQEVLDKILRDINSIEIQARNIIINTNKALDYNDIYKKLCIKKNNPQTISDLLFLYWYMPKKFLT